jgi:AraC-like DNA-binding protein
MCKDEKNENFTLISIAYDSGFNSKATFNRVFKNITGITPGAYYKNVSGK